MKKKLSVLIVMLMVITLSVVTAPVAAAEPGTLLSATGAIGTGNEDRIEVSVPAGTTLGDIDSIAWSEYLLEGYPPHVDVILDLGESVTDALVFEYAYNSDLHYADGPMPYGALTDAWYQTFSDDGEGPAAVTDTSFAWISSGAPGPYPVTVSLPVSLPTTDFVGGTLADWKSGGIVSSIDSSTPVLRLEIEVDNWVVDCQALVDNIEVILAGEAIEMEVTILLVPDILAISVSPTSIDFGDLSPGETSALFPITVENVGTVDVDITTLVSGAFFIDNLYLDEGLATAYTAGILANAQETPVAKVVVPSPCEAGSLSGTLTFEATAQ